MLIGREGGREEGEGRGGERGRGEREGREGGEGVYVSMPLFRIAPYDYWHNVKSIKILAPIIIMVIIPLPLPRHSPHAIPCIHQQAVIATYLHFQCMRRYWH